MWEQILWVLVSFAGFVMVWIPGLGSGRIRTIANWTGIAIFSLPWFWLPFTSQPRVPGVSGFALTLAGGVYLIFGFGLCAIGTRKIAEAVGWSGHGDPSRLVTDRVYRLIRHPVYSGLFTAMLGWALIWEGVYAILLMPALLLLFMLEAWLEERLLRKKFGGAFEAYRRSVPAFFPAVMAVPLLVTAILVALGILWGSIPVA